MKILVMNILFPRKKYLFITLIEVGEMAEKFD